MQVNSLICSWDLTTLQSDNQSDWPRVFWPLTPES